MRDNGANCTRDCFIVFLLVFCHLAPFFFPSSCLWMLVCTDVFFSFPLTLIVTLIIRHNYYAVLLYYIALIACTSMPN